MLNGTQQLLLYKLLAGTPGHDTGQGNPVLRALLSGRTPVKQCWDSTIVRQDSSFRSLDASPPGNKQHCYEQQDIGFGSFLFTGKINSGKLSLRKKKVKDKTEILSLERFHIPKT